MKLLCILITLAIVNVSPIMTALYPNSVYIANKSIIEASTKDPKGLEAAISSIINKNRFIGTLNRMLAAPEDTFINSLPENVAVSGQEKVQEAISEFTELPVPKLGPKEDFESAHLKTLGDVRRPILGKITKQLLIDAIGGGKPSFSNFPYICLLIGFLRSMRFPEAITRKVDVDPSSKFCILTSQSGIFKYHLQEGPKPEDNTLPEKYIAAVRLVADVESFVNVLDEIEFWFNK